MIDIKLIGLVDTTKDINWQIGALLSKVASINNICKSLNSGSIWEGQVASKFQEAVERLTTYANEKVLDLRQTNIFKEFVVSSFVETEKQNASNYKA